MKEWLKLNKDDRKVLLIIMVLYALLVAFMWVNKDKVEPRPAPSPESELLAVDSLSNEEPTELADTSVPLATPETPKDTLPIRTSKYPGPLTKQRDYTPKLKAGATIDLNAADTLLLQRVPSIGPSFARRIVKYRAMLGGYYCVEQLQEVYGMDRERYDKIAPYMTIRTSVRQLILSVDSIPRHPYLSYRHKRALEDILAQNPPLTWEKIMSSAVFTKDDSLRLAPYLKL